MAEAELTGCCCLPGDCPIFRLAAGRLGGPASGWWVLWWSAKIR
jgi:hypothetical protein